VLIVALAVRAVSLHFESQLPMFRAVWLDSQIYDDAGKIIAGGDWTLGREVLHMSPAYCYLVGFVYSFLGGGPWPIRVVEIAIGLITVASVFGAARRLFGEWWGFAAGLVAALYGPFIFYDTQLLADGLATALSAAFLYLLLRAREAGNRRFFLWVSLGLVWGLAIITRPNALLLVVPVALAAWSTGGSRRDRVLAFCVAGLAAVLMVLPISFRNLLVAKEAVLVTDTGGMNFYIGNGPDSAGTFHAPPGVPDADKPRAQFIAYKNIAERATGYSLNARQVDTFWVTKTWRYIGQHPLVWLRLMGEKLWLFWNAREVSNTEDYSFVRTLNPLLGGPLIQFGWIAPFALVGTFLFLFRRRKDEWVVGATNLMLCAANIAVFILARYRLAAVPGLIVAAVGCLSWLVELGRQRAWRPLIGVAVAFVPLLLLVWAPKLPPSPDLQYLKLGNAYYATGDLAAARVAYQTSVDHNADNISAQKNVAVLSEVLGDRPQSQAHWREVARIASQTGREEYAKEAAKHLSATP
jgi:4-amino-4-deoxy-L-arabinose transferase-like glycosyltransferase